MKGEKKKPRNYIHDIDLNKMWKFVWSYFESQITLPAFSEEEIQNIHFELMSKEERIVIFSGF